MFTSCWEIVTSLSFFGFLVNLEQSRDRIPDSESAKVMLSVTVTFCRTKLKTELKILQHSSHTNALSKSTFLDKERYFFAKKKMLTSAKLRERRHSKVYYLELNMVVCLCAKFEVSYPRPSPHTSNEPLKSPPIFGLKF